MSIVNQDKPTTSLTNSDRANIGETWATIITTWATETRTWQRLVSIFTNMTQGATGYLWSSRRYPWTEATPWLYEGPITNINKP